MRALVLIALLTISCGKKEEAAKTEAQAAPSASASASAAKSEKKAAPSEVAGSYASKQAAVRTPEDAPPFIHPESKEGIGEGVEEDCAEQADEDAGEKGLPAEGSTAEGHRRYSSSGSATESSLPMWQKMMPSVRRMAPASSNARIERLILGRLAPTMLAISVWLSAS